MERRYLVAALAIIATFAVTSRGFRTLEHISFVHAAHAGGLAKTRCESSPAARAIAKIGTRLRPRFPEEAQLLAEMNVPLADMQTTIAEQMARQDTAIAQCARARAMRDAERAYRDAMRVRDRMTSATAFVSMPPPAISELPPDIEARMQQKAVAMATRIAASNLKLQMASEKLHESAVQMDKMDFPVIEVTDDGGKISTHVHVHTNVKCKVNRSETEPRQPE